MSTTRRATGINAGDPTRANLFEFLGIHLPDWMSNGLCAQADPDAWFPEKGGSTREAKRLCNGRTADDGGPTRRPPCPVREQCLRWALDHEERYGIWGGVSERDRRRLSRERRAAS